MALVRWEPMREIGSIQNEVNRLFDTFFDTPAATRGAEGRVRRWVPAMDLTETDDQFVLRADLPGVSEDDVHIELEQNTLTVSGERKESHESEHEGFHRVERAYGSFSRSLTLPEGVDPDGVSASFDNGVLEVRVPKPVQGKPRRIEISGRQPAAIEGTESAPADDQ
ncbi:MAG TPA: Hsp20/alpha crystallin family protein [Conexibacter sp.]